MPPLALIVEDDLDIRMLFEATLIAGGWSTLTAGNVNDAIAILEKNTPDVALIDMNMPMRPGTDLLAHMNTQPQLEKTKRIVITANPLTESRVEELGADLFLLKPVSIQDLMRLITRLTS